MLPTKQLWQQPTKRWCVPQPTLQLLVVVSACARALSSWVDVQLVPAAQVETLPLSSQPSVCMLVSVGNTAQSMISHTEVCRLVSDRRFA